jgi:hypothetical protein
MNGKDIICKTNYKDKGNFKTEFWKKYVQYNKQVPSKPGHHSETLSQIK